MKKSKLTRSLLAACSIVALTAVMYGCSSSGEDRAKADRDELQAQIDALQEAFGDEDITPEAIMALIAERDDATADVTRLEGELATATGERDGLQTMLDAATAEVTRLEGELATATDERDGLQTMLDAATAEVTRLEGELATAQTALDDANTALAAALKRAEDAEAELTQLEEDAAEALAALALADRIARGGAIETAISTNRLGDYATSTARTIDTLPDSSGVDGLSVERDVAGTITVDVNGDDDDDYAGGETTAGDDDWNSVRMTREDAGGESTHTLVIYTDIEEPADKPFTDLYDRNARDDILNDADRVKLAQAADFPSGASQSVTYGGDTGNPESFAGTFAGVSGTYECTSGTTCTVTTDADGDLVMAENWRFTPDSNLATIKDPDVAYAYFGWWMNEPKESDDPHTVEVFAAGTDGHVAAVADTIEGTATYSGPAAGIYQTQTFTAGAQTEAAVGDFTATASLVAKFGDEAATGTIDGTITDFTLGDGTSAAWKVMLEDTGIRLIPLAPVPQHVVPATSAAVSDTVAVPSVSQWVARKVPSDPAPHIWRSRM